ncbi:MAG: YaaA family protein [Spirochaetaceae bacterium]
MKILISPTKKQVINCTNNSENYPFFIDSSTELITQLRNLDIEGTQKLLRISDVLAIENWERLTTWNAKPVNKRGSTALFTFIGEAFNYLEAASFSNNDLDYANKNLLIFSGLYGLIKPLDIIMPYRLDIKDPLKVNSCKSLYEYWSEKLTCYLKNEIIKDECNLLIDLSSKEYSKSIKFAQLPIQTIVPDFKTEVNGKLKTVAIWSKRMRGLLAKEIIKYKIKTEVELQDLTFQDYKLEEISKGKYLYINR